MRVERWFLTGRDFAPREISDMSGDIFVSTRVCYGHLVS